MKFLNKHSKVKNFAVLILTLILTLDMQICLANVQTLKKYHSYSKVSLFAVELFFKDKS